MKKFVRLATCFVSSSAVSIAVGWWYIIHYARTAGLTEQNVDTFIWTVIGLGMIATAGLTGGLYWMAR
jgi:hypothetical protein